AEPYTPAVPPIPGFGAPVTPAQDSAIVEPEPVHTDEPAVPGFTAFGAPGFEPVASQPEPPVHADEHPSPVGAPPSVPALQNLNESGGLSRPPADTAAISGA